MMTYLDIVQITKKFLSINQIVSDVDRKKFQKILIIFVSFAYNNMGILEKENIYK